MKNIIYKLSKFFFNGFLIFTIILTFGSLFGMLEYHNFADFFFINFKESLESNTEFLVLKIPFRVEILFGWFLLFILIALYFYCYYFYALKNFFEIFNHQKVFNEKSLQKLSIFQRLNYIPAIVFFARGFYSLYQNNSVDGELLIIGFIHFFVAFILWYYIDLIKKGFVIQQENDLTI